MRYAEEVTELEAKQKQLDDIDQSYYVTVSYLLNLFEQAADIFKVAKVNEKTPNPRLVTLEPQI